MCSSFICLIRCSPNGANGSGKLFDFFFLFGQVHVVYQIAAT